MKISRYSLLVFVITILIFFIPFFWLKPGEMDLGGDNSRLYFYDPIAYLLSQSTYSVSHSAFGGENLSYYAIPFFLLLAFIKSIVHSPTIVISIFHGLNLSLGFFACYLVVKELLKGEEEAVRPNQSIIETSGILAGLYYTFSPNPIHWWGYPLLPMNVVFLNPLLFFLLLRFFLTGGMRYLLVSLLVTFIFSSNFSFIGSPTFFSFFPLAVLFLGIYTKYIKRKSIPIAKIAVGLVLFVLLQAFHLIPQIVSILTPGSFLGDFIFGAQGKLEWGLKYFVATAPSIKVSYALLGLLQYTEPKFYWWIFILFPLLFVLGLLWNKSKLYLLSTIFFLITLFFVSANITHIGLKLYELAFRLPGFAMFRVFYGQWQWAYLFFYTVLVGLALSSVFTKIRAAERYVLTGFIVILLVSTSWQFISGQLTDTKLWQSKDIRSHIKMDPVYEDVLAFIRSLPVDGKILSLPLNDHGYQVLKGENDAAYIGPSTITYLAARNEFTSIAELGVFGESILAAAKEKNYTKLKNILIMLNIKYIFYNADPYIYGDNFPALPYTRARDFFPDTQEGYKEFIKGLGVKEIKTIANTFHIYEFDDTSYIPHIYTPKSIAYSGDVIAVNASTPVSFYTDKRVAFFDDSTIFNARQELFDTVLLKARNTSTIFDFFKKKKSDRFVSPTVSRKLSSFIYPLVVLREKRDLNRYGDINDAYIDRSIYFAEKRINELYELKDTPLRRNIASISQFAQQWREPTLWEFFKFSEYNSWEVTLARYQQAIKKIIIEIDSTNQSAYSRTTSKVELKTYLKEHKEKLRTAIRQDSSLNTEDRRYLSGLIDGMFIDIHNSLSLDLPDVGNIPYIVENPLPNGKYEVYVNKNDMDDLPIDLSVGGMKLSPMEAQYEEWLKYSDMQVENKQSLPLVLSIRSVPNLVAQTHWTVAEQISLGKEQGAIETDPVTLAVMYNFLSDTSGLLRDIPNWEGDTIYAISFDYLTNDQNFLMVLHEKGDTETNRFVNDAYEETIRSKEWRKFKVAVLSAKDASSASLQITRDLDDVVSQDEETIKKIEIKNLTVQKIYNPNIVLKSIPQSTISAIPRITFTQINPTKYTVEVRDAKGPYALVLSQSFNQKWKLFYPSLEHEAKTIKGMLARVVGGILGSVTKSIIPETTEGSNAIVASYANGAIQEGKHRIDFWNRDTFDTWGFDPIAEKSHLPVNGYANSWVIKPEDVNNRSDYTLIIEMTSQKLFYGSLLLSGFGLLIILFLCLKLFLRK
ncbi:MAG: hypothetical protein AAB557_03270 [Patescibacteria group bacterium]